MIKQLYEDMVTKLKNQWYFRKSDSEMNKLYVPKGAFESPEAELQLKTYGSVVRRIILYNLNHKYTCDKYIKRGVMTHK